MSLPYWEYWWQSQCPPTGESRTNQRKQVAISNARSNYTLGKAQQDMIDAGVLKDSEKEEYHYDKDSNKAYWEGQINGKTYRAYYDGETGEGKIESGN